MTTFIITGTFNSVSEMVEHLQSPDHSVKVSTPEFEDEFTEFGKWFKEGESHGWVWISDR